MSEIELFNNTMQFQMPPAHEVAKLPPEAQERFVAVRTANDRLGNAIRHRERIEARIAENDAERIATDTEMKSLRRPWTQMDETKAMIAFQQDERARERGYR